MWGAVVLCCLDDSGHACPPSPSAVTSSRHGRGQPIMWEYATGRVWSPYSPTPPPLPLAPPCARTYHPPRRESSTSKKEPPPAPSSPCDACCMRHEGRRVRPRPSRAARGGRIARELVGHRPRTLHVGVIEGPGLLDHVRFVHPPEHAASTRLCSGHEIASEPSLHAGRGTPNPSPQPPPSF